ncbi:MAG TPA: hypothetical protein VER36_09360 [Flavisolibacter sp.]|nr:hypothetical protein [Flavisolibacter sp.]
MKNTKRLILSVALFLTTASHAQVSNPDTMVQRIFTALKARDEKAMVALYPNKDQMLKLFSRIMSGLVAEIAKADTTNKKEINTPDLNQMMLEKMKQMSTEQEINKEYEKVANEFRKIINEGEQKGIKWDGIIFSKSTLDIKDLTDETAIKIFGSAGMKEMKGTLYFSSGNAAYNLRFSDVLYLPEEGGWYGGRLRSLNNPDKAELQAEDVTVEPKSKLQKPVAKPKGKTGSNLKSKKKS